MGSLRNNIKKILNEDFEWMGDSTSDKIPVEDIKKWCYENMSNVSHWVQKIEEEMPKLPRIEWGDRERVERQMKDKERLATEALRYVAGDLRNIYESMNEIISNLENPND